MTDTKRGTHTPGPWRHSGVRYGDITGQNSSFLIASIPQDSGHAPTDRQRLKNAERIVACVNACAGIENPGEAVPMMVQALRDAIAVLECGEVLSGSELRRVIKACEAAIPGEV